VGDVALAEGGCTQLKAVLSMQRFNVRSHRVLSSLPKVNSTQPNPDGQFLRKSDSSEAAAHSKLVLVPPLLVCQSLLILVSRN